MRDAQPRGGSDVEKRLLPLLGQAGAGGARAAGGIRAGQENGSSIITGLLLGLAILLSLLAGRARAGDEERQPQHRAGA